MIRDVPGFIPISTTYAWCVNSGVALISILLTTFCLPALAGMLHRGFSALHLQRLELIGTGKFLAALVFPNLVTMACHEHCFGAWVLFWLPCRHHVASTQ
eukprot:5234498-Amphidinium_carterae.1